MLIQLPKAPAHPHKRYLLICFLLAVLLVPTALLAQEEESPPSHVVQLGDTLSEIAQQYATDTDTLRRLNGLGDVDFVWVGQRLILPADEAVAGTPTTPSAVDDEPTAGAEATPGAATTQAADAAPGDAADTAAAENEVALTPSPAKTVAPPTPTAEPTTTPTDVTATPTIVDPATLPEPVLATDLTTDIYVVQAGDTLSQIAVRYRTTLAHLIEFNQISPAQRLQAGQALVVPVSGSATAAVPTVQPLEHIVQQGEHLSTIAAQYDLSTADIISANRLNNANLLVPGQRLLIPQGTDPQDALAYLDNLRTGSDGYHVHTEFPTLTEKWIDVDLSEQRLVAYRGKKPIRTFIISSGMPDTPTVTGSFRIWAKTPLQDMYAGNRAAGYSYYVEDVQWVQYFYKDYGFHAAYWHDNFGQPMSHGCIHLRTDEAKWLFDWAGPTMTARDGWFISDEEYPGTLVVVHE